MFPLRDRLHRPFCASGQIRMTGRAFTGRGLMISLSGPFEMVRCFRHVRGPFPAVSTQIFCNRRLISHKFSSSIRLSTHHSRCVQMFRTSEPLFLHISAYFVQFHERKQGFQNCIKCCSAFSEILTSSEILIGMILRIFTII